MITLSETQTNFMIANTFDIDEILFGGAAGGGKSFALVADVYEYCKLPKASALLFRRTFPELQESIINKALEFYPLESYKYNSSEKIMTFVNGSRLKFGYLENENDKFRYQGGEWGYIGFDELTHFSETQYLYMKSRNRNTKGYPNVMRGTSNPGGKYHDWVKDRFIDKAKPNEIRETIEEVGEKKYVTKLLYIPSLLKDNPNLNEDEYTKSLMHLPDIEREALLNGNWELSFGEIFKRSDFKVITEEQFKLMTNFEVDEDWELEEGYGETSLINYMTVDVAVTNSKTSDSSAFTIGCIDPNNNKYVKKSAAKKLLSNDLLEQTLKYARDYECMEIGIEDSAVSKTFIENLQDAIYIRNLPYVITKLKPNGRNKEARIQQYILSAMNQNRLYFIDKVDEDLISEAINFPNAIHDDLLDSTAYFIEMGNNLLSRNGTITNAINPISKSRRTAINGNTNNVY